jgi:hypothetical protein
MTRRFMKLSAEPDGFGFFYGWVERNGERVRVDVLPPEHLWRGDIKLEGQKPDARAWILYLDGEEFARVELLESLERGAPLSKEIAGKVLEHVRFGLGEKTGGDDRHPVAGRR